MLFYVFFREGKRPKMTDDSLLCFNCFQLGHSIATSCSNLKVQACRNCFRLNVSSIDCNCQDTSKIKTPKKLRLAGDKMAPRPYIDVRVHQKLFPALISTGRQNTSANWKLDKWIYEKERSNLDEKLTEIELAMDINGDLHHVECEISRTQKEDIEIGTHLLQFLDFQMTFNGTTINSKSSPIESTRKGTHYLYNHH